MSQSLRGPMRGQMQGALAGGEVKASPPGTAVQHAAFPAWPLVISVGIVALLVGLVWGQRGIAPLRRQLAGREQVIAAQVAQMAEQEGQLQARQNEVVALEASLARFDTTCDDAGAARSQVSGFLGQGQLELAVGLVEATLAQQVPPLCEGAKAALAGLWYGASMDRLFSTPRPDWPGSQVEAELVARWRAIEAKAGEYGVPSEAHWPPMTVAIRAYNAGLWALTDAAFRQAWAEGEVGEPAARFRHDALRNWGYQLAHHGDGAEREQAVRLLTTAWAISQNYRLGKGEACQDLVELGYDCAAPPQADPQEPVLAGRAGG